MTISGIRLPSSPLAPTPQGSKPAAHPDRPAPAPQAQPLQMAASRKEQKGPEVLTSDEKEFFAKLYPEASGALRSHAVYTRGGEPPAAVPGTLIDRKG